MRELNAEAKKICEGAALSWFDPLRDEPRFQAVMPALKFPD